MIIVKLGGGREINVEGVIKDLAELDQKFLILHGANAVRDEIAEKLGKPTRVVTSVSGYSIVFSDKDAIDAIMMGYSASRTSGSWSSASATASTQLVSRASTASSSRERETKGSGSARARRS